MAEENLTQELTQRQFDPRRNGLNNSGLCDNDISDVICILHPGSPVAFDIVNYAVEKQPQHVLQNNGLSSQIAISSGIDISEASTIVMNTSYGGTKSSGRDLALRFSSSVQDPALGFCFGRNPLRCDINLDNQGHQKRVSNVHFRIYLNTSGVLMIEDRSTNGTVVDTVLLGGKKKTVHGMEPKGQSSQRMLSSGSVIEILSEVPGHYIKFFVRIPPRDGHIAAYRDRYQQYMSHCIIAEERAQLARNGGHMPDGAIRGVLAAPLMGPANTKSIPKLYPPNMSNEFGMHWNGGEIFKCTGVLGKGAFATVYQVATRMHGELYACKELEKTRFMKNGRLDQRLDNEMQIMKDLRHPGIVQFVDYIQTEQHLYIIMEYVACGDMTGYMKSHGTVPEDLAKAMTVQILKALEYLHERDITHRDIKPDNILIHTEDPFIVKLTDFGLSKVVKNNETFLKTFCGTLLYCAPEVFPHYDNYVANRRMKRPRNTRSSRRSYSQLVDIWSYAAVLWYVLCANTPFEGVVDTNGKGMFNRIMETPLDTQPLRDQAVTEDCINLLLMMLDTDPGSRPDEVECLRHPWLNEAGHNFDITHGLGTIPEGNEELDASQLRIHDDQDTGNDDSEPSQDSQDKRVVKRQKSEAFLGARQPEEIPSEEQSYEEVPLVNDIFSSHVQPTSQKPPKLFGEISQNALQSSGLLGRSTTSDAPSLSTNGSIAYLENRQRSAFPSESHDRHPHPTSVPLGPAESFRQVVADFRPPQLHSTNSSWRESMVGELNMDTSNGEAKTQFIEQQATPRQPQPVPRTPSQSGINSQPQQQVAPGDQEVTPRPRKPFNRQINIPIAASVFYEAGDPGTHNLEYASKKSGLMFGPDGTAIDSGTSLPTTIGASDTSSSSENEVMHTAPVKNEDSNGLGITMPSQSSAQPQVGGFTKPDTPYGFLHSTASSIGKRDIALTRRTTTFGRSPGSSSVWEPRTDTRIAKVALEVWFLAPGISQIEAEDKPWTTMRHLEVVVATQARFGIYINGTHMKPRDEKGRKCYSRVYTGDEICVYRSGDHTEHLTFTCDFKISKSKERRVEQKVDIRGSNSFDAK